MTKPLSPAAKTVLSAYYKSVVQYASSPNRVKGNGKPQVAAVLRTAADWLAITNGESPSATIWEIGFRAGVADAQQRLLTLALELER